MSRDLEKLAQEQLRFVFPSFSALDDLRNTDFQYTAPELLGRIPCVGSCNVLIFCRDKEFQISFDESGYVFLGNGDPFHGLQGEIAIHLNRRNTRIPRISPSRSPIIRGVRTPLPSTPLVLSCPNISLHHNYLELTGFFCRYKQDNTRNDLPDELHELLRLLLSRQPDQRPSCQEVLKLMNTPQRNFSQSRNVTPFLILSRRY